MTPERRRVAEQRGEALRKAWQQAQARAMEAASLGWDASPISTARLSAELWALVKNEDWAMVSRDSGLSNWPHRIWNFDKPYQYIGHSGGAGQATRAAASEGAPPIARRSVITAARRRMLLRRASLTAVHHKISVLTVMT